MKAWTSPGSDEFPLGFYQKMWDIVGNDIVEMVQSFCHTKHMLRKNNHNFLSLIPKTNCHKTADDFKPISLCNTSNKIISKLIANRLKCLLSKIISPYQAAFVEGRQMTDNIVMIDHEIINIIEKKVKLKKVC